MARGLPTGTVTFLFTDVEGSTALLQELGAEAYATALGEHREIVRRSLAAHGGVEVDTQGDSFFCAFGLARAAVECAQEVLALLAATPIRVRMGLHTGEALVDGGRYVGLDVHRAARLGACGHGGQAVLSPSTVALLEPGAVPLLDLGEHRLKDLSAPVRLHQLGTAEFPPLRTLFRTNLPVPATEFVGRVDELRGLVERATAPARRLLTLTGPGGTGKTRLALQLAGELADCFPDGVRWAPLAALRDPALVASTVAGAVEIDEEPRVAPAEAIARGLGGRRLLLLLDNCEHVLDACAAVVASVVAGCPNVLALATSREPLGVSGENVFPVDPLEPGDAVTLFEVRARAAGADLAETETSREVVAELCARLDELPLALELAAARAAAIPPAALLERLPGRLDALRGPRDADERQRTLLATIAWSHDLLEPGEQALFRRLSVFRGGATLDAAEAVCEADLEELASLVGKSLLRQQEGPDGLPRYWMLETIREFAAAALDDAGESDVYRERQLEWFASVADGLRNRLVGPSGPDLPDGLERDRENLRTALERAHALERRDAAIALADILARLHRLHGRFAEAEDVLRAALALEPQPLEAARLESSLGAVLTRRRRAREAWEAHLSAERRLDPVPDDGNPGWWRTWIEVKLGQAYHQYWHAAYDGLPATIAELEPRMERYASPAQRVDFLHIVQLEAYRREHYVLSEETEARARELHREARAAGLVDAEFGLGFCLLWRGKPGGAERHLRLGLEEAQARGAALVEVRCLVYGAIACRFQNDVEGARELLARLGRLDDELGYSGLAAAMRCWVASRDGDVEAAERHGEAALADWAQEARARPTVFQWSARFPLLGIDLERGRLESAFEHAGAMLDGSQQPLPRELHSALAEAVERGERAPLEHAFELARARGYA